MGGGGGGEEEYEEAKQERYRGTSSKRLATSHSVVR